MLKHSRLRIGCASAVFFHFWIGGVFRSFFLILVSSSNGVFFFDFRLVKLRHEVRHVCFMCSLRFYDGSYTVAVVVYNSM